MTLREIEALIRDLAMHVDPEPTRRYEALAERYHAETGNMAPGKDMPAAMAGEGSSEQRRIVWEQWMQERFEVLHEQCMEMLGESSPATSVLREIVERGCEGDPNGCNPGWAPERMCPPCALRYHGPRRPDEKQGEG